MATVNLSWTVEGLHDGIRVERGFVERVDYLDTLPAGTTEFEDDFSISKLAEHYDTEPENLDLLTYRLTTFRGDKEKSTIVHVPVVDTDPEWVQNLVWPDYGNGLKPISVPILTSRFNAAINADRYGELHHLEIYLASNGFNGNETYALYPWSGDNEPFADDYDFTQLHDLNFGRMINSQINNDATPLMTDVVVGTAENPFEHETYVLSFFMDNPNNGEYLGDSFNPGVFETEGAAPDFFFLSPPFVSIYPEENDSVTGMAIMVYNNHKGDATVETIPWTPNMKGTYVYVAKVAIADIDTLPKAPE